MIKQKCLNCNKEFDTYPSQNKKFCSLQCRHLFQQKLTPYVTFVCEQCGKTFTRNLRSVISSYNKGNKVRYCSKVCKSNAWGSKRVKQKCHVCGKTFFVQAKDAGPYRCCSPECSSKNEYNRTRGTGYVTLFCHCCGKPFVKKQQYINHEIAKGRFPKFCSKECYLNTVKSPRTRNTKRETHCLYCGKEFTAVQKAGQPLRQFCNWKCYIAYHEKQYEDYRNLSSKARSSIIGKQWTKSVLQRANYRCEICDDTQNLEAHHIYSLYNIFQDNDMDIDKVISSDIFQDISNGQCLCKACHDKQHPYVTRIRDNKGRFSRLEYKVTKKT